MHHDMNVMIAPLQRLGFFPNTLEIFDGCSIWRNSCRNVGQPGPLVECDYQELDGKDIVFT